MNQEDGSALTGFAPAAVVSEQRADGIIVRRCPRALQPYTRCVGAYLEHWAQVAPARVFLAQRQGAAWRRVSYGQALAAVRAIGANLLERGLCAASPLAILSDNSVNHALLALGAMHALSLLAPVAQDIVVAGHERDTVAFLLFVDPAGCRSLCPEVASDAPMAQVLPHTRVVAHVRRAMAELVAQGGGSSMAAERSLLMEEPASIDAGEITDKGYINQRAVLTRRAAWVERLYAGTPGAEVIVRHASARA